MARRIFLLGLDGGSWNVFDHLFAKGVMPNFQRLCSQGVKGTLESTMPPVTPVAWTSLMTGANPGKHGVFAFRKTGPENSYLPIPVNRMDMEIPTIFDYYREDKGFVCLNLPMSFPATELDGCMVTGMMTPQGQTDQAAHPADLLDRFSAAGIDYVIDPKLQESSNIDPQDLLGGWKEAPAEFITRLGRIMDNRMKAVHLLMDQQDWSVFICVVVGTDRLQHLFWDDIVGDGTTELTSSVWDYYRRLDEKMGRLMDELEDDDVLMLVSDHGFVKTHGSFQTNEWLRRQGWLKKREAKKSPLYPLKVLLNRMGITRAKLGRVLSEGQSSKLQLMASHIDWAGSQAFLNGPFAIRINLKDRETLGCVAPKDFDRLVGEIIERLGELKDDEGKPMIAEIFRGSDIYHGDACGQAGDVVFSFRDDLNYVAYAGDLGSELFRTDIAKNGDHRVDGIFAAWGGGIRNLDHEIRLSICDILPTLMHLNGRAVPEVCDGKIALEITEDDHSPESDRDWRRFAGTREAVTYNRDQEAEINQRLKDLGYLSDD